MSITDLVTATNLSEYYVATQTNNQETIGDRLFPARKQLGLRLDFVKGANNQPVVLKASAFDTQASLRDRMPIELDSMNMPFFREGMKVKEEERQQLNQIADNQGMVDIVAERIFNDQATLIQAAKARVQAMRLQVLATGKLAIESNGVKREFDYQVPEKNQGKVKIDWAETEADPLNDIDEAVEKARLAGSIPAGMILNSKTFGQVRKAEATARRINGAKNKPATRRDVLEFLRDEYSLNIELIDETYVNDEKESVKFFPDGYVVFVPNNPVGYTNYGTTPEESDLQAGNNSVDVKIVDTGVAITTEVTNNPVNVDTNVSMINLPSFEGANQVFQLLTGLTLEDPVEPEDPETGE